MATFNQQIKGQPYAGNVIFLTGNSERHLMKPALMDMITDFFKANL
ncbi:hypothetical protein [Latilactobacillus fragifolii]|nr:hypothetical protein [Latilactobacillus fragifolii]